MSRIPMFDLSSPVVPAWEEFADAPVHSQYRPKRASQKNPDGFFEQCFRCKLPDCQERSRECQVYVETGRFINGKTRRYTRKPLH